MWRLTTEEAVSLFENLSSDSRVILEESSSDEEISIDDTSVISSPGLLNAENFDSNSDEDLEKQNVPKVWKKRDATTVIPIFSLNSGFVESFYNRLSTPIMWYH
ncbi:hypothetical protein NPIL_10931 [Nephila pilipes]|uniref:Uncharacterized protein n=1 Tax=Nephila pilipes TaxID=299642 RepID=A0A8X6P2V4_NEPPI|nr:hypothetical protein NPIL_10931 [Nephila pilipes]